MLDVHHRIQRREFSDYQPLFTLINSLDIIDEATRRDFVFKHGPVWQRYNAVTKGAQRRRITVLFLGDETNSFEELLFVGCDCVKQRIHQCQILWSGHPLGALLDDAAVRHLCLGLAGRSVLTWAALLPCLQAGAHSPYGATAASSRSGGIAGSSRSLPINAVADDRSTTGRTAPT